MNINGTMLQNELLAVLMDDCENSVLRDYIVPGLDSRLVGGTVRFFEMTRPQELYVAPHTHRYYFAACVVRGRVRNTLYSPHDEGHLYAVFDYDAARGELSAGYQRQTFKTNTDVYEPGDWYAMGPDQFHSIEFSEGAIVLLLESRTKRPMSKVLQACRDGVVLHTFQKNEWMQRA